MVLVVYSGRAVASNAKKKIQRAAKTGMGNELARYEMLERTWDETLKEFRGSCKDETAAEQLVE